MADVITFSCNQCHTPYRVAAANAGRAFACKSCGTQLVVPQASTPPAPIVVPQDPEVQLGAGEQVIRKTDSARRASVDPTRMITRNSGAHLAVRHAPTAVAAPAAKSGRGLLIGAIAGGVVVVALVAGLWAAGVFSGKPAAGPGTNTPNIAANAPAANTPKERSEREQIMLELGAPGRTPASMIALYKRAVAARLDKADLSVVARAAVDQVANENMSGLTEDEVLDFGQQLERDGYVTEPGRLYLLVSRRWLGKADPPPAFERAQKLRKLEKLDFTPLLSRADEILQSGVLDSAKPLRDELVKMSEESESGWVSAETAARFAEIDRTLGDQQAEVERLKRENPFLFVAARARHHFNSQRVASRSAWGVHVSEPLVIYYELRKGFSEETDRAYYLPLIQMVEQFAAFYRDEFVKPMKLSRTLPTDIADAAEREQAPLEVLLFHDRTSWRPYLSDARVRGIDTARQSHYTEQPSGRFSYVFEGTSASTINLATMFMYHCIDTWHPRAVETRDKPAFKTWVLEIILPACVSLYQAAQDGDDTRYTFFHHDDRWRRLMHRWRQPFASSGTANIDSFGGPAVTMRDIIAAQNVTDFVDAFERNVKTYPGWPEDRLKSVVDEMRAPNSRNLNTVLTTYFRGFAMFLWHFEKGGKPKYRDKFRTYLLADLNGKINGPNQVEEFAKAFGLDEKGWKELEADFVSYQSAP